MESISWEQFHYLEMGEHTIVAALLYVLVVGVENCRWSGQIVVVGLGLSEWPH